MCFCTHHIFGKLHWKRRTPPPHTHTPVAMFESAYCFTNCKSGSFAFKYKQKWISAPSLPRTRGHLPVARVPDQFRTTGEEEMLSRQEPPCHCCSCIWICVGGRVLSTCLDQDPAASTELLHKLSIWTNHSWNNNALSFSAKLSQTREMDKCLQNPSKWNLLNTRETKKTAKPQKRITLYTTWLRFLLSRCQLAWSNIYTSANDTERVWLFYLFSQAGRLKYK